MMHRRFPPILQKVLSNLPMRVAGLVLQLLLSILLARIMGPAIFGSYTYALVWATIVGTFLTLGLEQLSIRQIPIFQEKRQPGRMSGFLLALWLTILAMTVVTGLAFWAAEMSALLVLSPGWFLVTAMCLVHALTLALSGALTGFQRISTSTFLENLPRGILLLVTAYALNQMGYAFTPDFMFWVVIWTSLPTLLVMMVLVRRMTHSAVPRDTPREYDLMVWYGASIPIAINIFAQLLRDSTDIIMVGALLGDYETGIYRTAARGAFLASFAIMVSVRVLGPYLSKAVAADDRPEAQRMLALAAPMTAGLGLAACLFLWIGAEFYLGLFGPAFTEGTPVLRVLLIGRGFEALTGAAAVLMIMYHQERLLLYINLVGLLANIVLNYILLQQYGLIGAAIATSATTIIFFSLTVLIVIRKTRLDPTLLSSVKRVPGWIRKLRGS